MGRLRKEVHRVYTSEISRSNPTVILILLDQSSSMMDTFAVGNQSKATEAALVVNRFLTELTIKCAKAEGILDYYEVAIVGYGRDVGTAFGGLLSGGDLHPISEIGNKPLRLEQVLRKVSDGAGGLVEEQADFPVWVEAKADGMTPMCRAFERAIDLLTPWTVAHPDSFPPTILNVTDGEANDGDPVQFASRLHAVATNDGNALVFNCHVSGSRSAKVEYPSTDEGLSDQFAQQLFAMSSDLPPAHLEAARGEGFAVSPGSRGFVFNAGPEDLIRFIDIGSRATLR